ncbi:LysR family transcriptional regulator [Pseudomonas sp. MDMC_285]|nr:LysR family transcriptional regulator [Pseudomonas sp. MDMC_285]
MLSQLRDLDLQLLRLFVTVVESGGFSAAQGELGIGQSTISTQMAKLETRLGFRLCERGKAGFRLTPKGEQVLAATRKLFAAIETFKGEAQGMADKLLGELRIGLSEALSDEVIERIGKAVGRFRQRNQAVQIELLSAMPAELERRLLQDQLQLAIGYFSGSQTALDYQPLFEERQRCTARASIRCSTGKRRAPLTCRPATAWCIPIVSSLPTNPGKAAAAARAANRSKAAWRSSSPVLTWAICPSTPPCPG